MIGRPDIITSNVHADIQAGGHVLVVIIVIIMVVVVVVVVIMVVVAVVMVVTHSHSHSHSHRLTKSRQDRKSQLNRRSGLRLPGQSHVRQ
jgi:uncharacterized membrane protein